PARPRSWNGAARPPPVRGSALPGGGPALAARVALEVRTRLVARLVDLQVAARGRTVAVEVPGEPPADAVSGSVDGDGSVGLDGDLSGEPDRVAHHARRLADRDERDLQVRERQAVRADVELDVSAVAGRPLEVPGLGPSLVVVRDRSGGRRPGKHAVDRGGERQR